MRKPRKKVKVKSYPKDGTPINPRDLGGAVKERIYVLSLAEGAIKYMLDNTKAAKKEYSIVFEGERTEGGIALDAYSLCMSTSSQIASFTSEQKRYAKEALKIQGKECVFGCTHIPFDGPYEWFTGRDLNRLKVLAKELGQDVVYGALIVPNKRPQYVKYVKQEDDFFLVRQR